MARAKYKLEQMVQFTNNGAADHDVINAVISKKDGYYYGLTKQDDSIAETDVLAAYRPVATRKPKAVAKKSSKKDAAKAAA